MFQYSCTARPWSPYAQPANNALLCAPANAIPFCFGNNSAHRHAQLTRLSDLTCEVVDLEKLSADIDVPEDLNTSLFADIAFGSKEREGAFQYA